MSDEDERDEENWEDEGGSAVREPRKPKYPPKEDSEAVESEELVAV